MLLFLAVRTTHIIIQSSQNGDNITRDHTNGQPGRVHLWVSGRISLFHIVKEITGCFY